jgi:hypothetical protein
MGANEERNIRNDGGCIKEIDLPYLIKKTKKLKVKRLVVSDILGTETERVFVPYQIDRWDKQKKESYIQHTLVDVVTGTLYDKMTGDCLSSTRLRLGD